MEFGKKFGKIQKIYFVYNKIAIREIGIRSNWCIFLYEISALEISESNIDSSFDGFPLLKNNFTFDELPKIKKVFFVNGQKKRSKNYQL